jgi:translation initiation factor IF-2
MADVTLKELAAQIGVTQTKLLSQMKDAGLAQRKGDATVTAEEKEALLLHLKTAHGESSEAPKQITLKRKTNTTLKAGGRKTVNVEVRKRRTYVKRTPEEIAQEAREEAAAKEAAALEEKARLAAEAEANK